MSFFRKYVTDAALLWLFPCVVVGGLFLAGAFFYPQHTFVLNRVQQSETCMAEAEQVSETASTVAAPDGLYAKHALLMDANNHRVLFEQDGYSEAPMASTTKIMTLLVALEQGDPERVITISEIAASMPEVKLGVRAGEQYRLMDLLYSLMLESHNDSAVAIAEAVGGTVDGFAALMNEKAQEIGALHTHFVTPNGLDADGHYTTAYDLALIAGCALENTAFSELIQTESYTFHEQTTGRTFSVQNKNRFLKSYEGAIGVKTGFTGNAGYCFVGAAERDGKRLVSVVLASGWPPHKNYKWSDTERLMDYGFAAYTEKQVLHAGDTFLSVPVTDSVEKENVTPYVSESVSLLLRDDEEVDITLQLPTSLTAPVKKDTVIGTATILIDDAVYQVVPLYAGEDRTRITYRYVLRSLLRMYFFREYTW